MGDKDKKSTKVIDYVALDKDWRGVLINEKRFQDEWQKDWGFLAVECSKIKYYYLSVR